MEDLVFSSHPTIVFNLDATPGMSDDEAIVFNIDISAVKANNTKARKTFIYQPCRDLIMRNGI